MATTLRESGTLSHYVLTSSMQLVCHELFGEPLSVLTAGPSRSYHGIASSLVNLPSAIDEGENRGKEPGIAGKVKCSLHVQNMQVNMEFMRVGRVS